MPAELADGRVRDPVVVKIAHNKRGWSRTGEVTYSWRKSAVSLS